MTYDLIVIRRLADDLPMPSGAGLREGLWSSLEAVLSPLEVVLGRSWGIRRWSWDLWKRSGAALEVSGKGLG